MAIKHVIGMGIGFSPGSVKYIPTLGFAIGAAVISTPLPARPAAARQTLPKHARNGLRRIVPMRYL